MIGEVLLVDDDDITLMICEFVIKKNSFAQNIIKTKDGKEGIDFFESLVGNDAQNPAPKVIFLDLNMPVMSGWDFLEDFQGKYQNLLPDTKVIILSSTIDPEDYNRSTNYDVVIDFINKPISDDDIIKLKNHPELKTYFN